MKQLVILFLLVITAVSCSKTPEKDACEDLTPCTDNCEFTYSDVEAMTYFLSCYDRWGFIYTESADDGLIGLIPDGLEDKYKTDSVSVMVCGYARENTLPLTFPDPSFSNVWQSDVVYIEDLD